MAKDHKNNNKKNGGSARGLTKRDTSFLEPLLEPGEFPDPLDVLRSGRSRLLSHFGLVNAFPRVDITEDEKEVRVSADIPGIDPDELEIEVRDDRMTIRGRIERELRSEKERPLRYERVVGEFRREFALPAPVDEDNVHATYKDGVLEITLPKTETGERKKIAIEKQ